MISRAGVFFPTRLLLLMLLMTFTITACADLFRGNLFENLDGPPDASELMGKYLNADGTVSTANAGKFVDAVAEAAESSKFYKNLSSSDRQKLNGALADVYNDPGVATADKQAASVLAAEVLIRGTDAGETINNVADVLTSNLGGDSFNDPGALMDLIIPAGAKGDPVAIKKILDDLVLAADAYDYLGESLNDSPPPSGVNMAETAQKAAVAIAVKKLVDDPGIGSTGDLAADIVAGSVSSTELDNFPGDTTNLENILAAGGLSGVFGGV
ncbi:MAG: hypothetical protein WCY01_05700 [Alkalispirochaeta sp.]